MNKIENLQYKRAVLLADTLTKSFNNNHYTYSGANWAAHEIFRKKQMHYYGIYPVVKMSGIDNRIVVYAEFKNVSHETFSS